MITSRQPWTHTQKWAFRFWTCFFLIDQFPFPLNFLDYVGDFGSMPKWLHWYDKIFDYYNDGLHLFIPWVGKHILHLHEPITVFTNGSGDTTYDYVSLMVFFVLSILGAVIWSVLDRNRSNYSRAYYWMRVDIRYFLGLTMFVYGFDKIFHLQMPFPYLTQLVMPFGYKSPMGLAWSFIGYSTGYSIFTGLGEVVGGALLFFRRTTLLGALLLIVVLSNVVAINYFYDVPVKIFSSVLLAMAAFLLAADVSRLWDLFVRNRTVPPSPAVPRLSKRWMRIARRILKPAVILLGTAVILYPIPGYVSQYGDNRKLPHYYGIYNVQTWVRNKDTIPPLETDTLRWKRLIIQFDGYATVYLTNDSSKGYVFKVDSTFQHVVLYRGADTSHKYNLSIRADSTSLWLSGLLGKDSIMAQFRKQDLKDFRLVSRGYHWVNEYPLNR